MLILVVDDDRCSRVLVREALGTRGYEVIQAVNVEDALRKAVERPPDVVLLDIEMPKPNGYDLLRRIRSDSRLRNAQVIALSRYAMAGDRERTLEAGFDACLSEPITFSAVRATIQAGGPKLSGFSMSRGGEALGNHRK